MYMFFNSVSNCVYRIDTEWWVGDGQFHVYLFESVWMVPDTVDPLED